MDASVDPEPGRPVPELNSLGELQGHGGRVDLLIALRHQQIGTLRGLLTSPADDSPPRDPEQAGWPLPAGTRPR